MAERPVRIRIVLPDGIAVLPDSLGVEWEKIGRNTIEIRCAESAKAEVIRRLAAAPVPFRDIEIHAPTLDEIYAHFLQREAAE
jgi:Cu-processing system ATP-binding protein